MLSWGRELTRAELPLVALFGWLVPSVEIVQRQGSFARRTVSKTGTNIYRQERDNNNYPQPEEYCNLKSISSVEVGGKLKDNPPKQLVVKLVLLDAII